ncbi:ABC transporter permease [Pacificimonas flava]|uniref:ABC transporter permease n=2 Tax=Pacificimonas TaxID=1960290 RepID=A0A219B487_9SPHN|nr:MULTISPECIES: efflux RND transporter permease subunit [Pacificimonas]MBZ6377063.1 efflux RND transporter permease subunit [Pacificimonas aurantium]OWV33202.1 ABC transporter permease [Pacificimonas flava]
MSLRNISSWSIQNPVVPIVLFIALTLGGIVSFTRLDVNQQPDISFPAATITVTQPGAAPSELKTQVTQRVEAAIRSVDGVDEIASVISEGSSRTNVQFMIGTPIDRAVNDVRDAVANIRSELPEGILEPRITRVTEGGWIGYLSVQASDMSLEELSWFVDDTVSKRLLSIPGMASVSRNGGVDREVRVELDPARLQAQGITAAQVNQQLRQLNLNAAGGRTEIAGSEQSVRVLGNAETIYDLQNTQLNLGGGRTIALSQVADIRDGYAEQRSYSTVDGVQALSISLIRAKGASDVSVWEAAMDELDQIEEEVPGLEFEPIFTTYTYTVEQYGASIMALIEGALLAVIVVWFFLRDWRAMLIAATAIPLSAIPTFWFMDLMGFTLNNLTLLALALVAGVLVDDAIVEIENIVRHMRMGKSPYQASMDAADEIGLAVVATTFSIVAVFFPVALMSGIPGQFFKPFGLTVVAAVLFSLAVARMVTPLMAAYFLRPHGDRPHAEGPVINAYERLLRWTLDRDRAVARSARGGFWRKLTAPLLDHRLWVIGVGAFAFLATIFAFASLDFTLNPEVDDDTVRIEVEMPPGATLAQTGDVVETVAQLLRDQPETSSVYSSVSVGSGSVRASLAEDRERSSFEFTRELGPALARIPNARVAFDTNNGFGGGSRPVNVMLAGSDPELLQQTAESVVEDMRQRPEMFVAPRIDGDLQRPEVVIRPNFALAADLGVTTATLSQTIRIATLGDIDQNVAKFSLSDRQIPIRVVLPQSARTSIATLENLPVPTATGGSVPLKAVADIGFGSGPSQLRRFNQQDRIVITSDLAPGIVAGEGNRAAQFQLPTMQELPPGVTRVQFGMSKVEEELTTQFAIAVVSGILLVFAVLILLYKRIMPPFVNMGSLLLAPLGGAIALHMTGHPISFPVLIGLLMLLGIVAKNSILLIDFALEEMQAGVPRRAAIIDAGRKRAQPIVMTTIAMAAGMLPTALSLSGDGAWRAPMGIVVIGGLILSTVLTLLIVPASFSFSDDIERGIRRMFGGVTNSPTKDEDGLRGPGAAQPGPAE